MRNLFIILVIALVAMANPSETSAQSRRELRTMERMVTSLNEQREVELNRANSRLEDAVPGTEANIMTEITQINERYDKLVSEAMSIGQKPVSTQREKEPKRTMPGANIAHQGNSGSYTGNSMSATKGADAYATVTLADANAQLIKSLSGGGNSIIPASSMRQVGLEGVITNKYRYKEATIVVTGYSPENKFYRESFLLGRGQQETHYLLPGKYSVTITHDNKTEPLEDIYVNPGQTHNYMGKKVFWFIAGGNN